MKRGAFSLLEMIVVVAIIGLLAALILPAFTNVFRAQSLTGAGASVVDELALARQTALAQNRVVEVRFYKRRENLKLPADAASNPERVRAFRSIIYDEQVRNYRPLTNLQAFPPNIVALEEREFSTLLYPFPDTAPPRAWSDETLPEDGPVKYQFIRFKPGGGTDLAPGGTSDQDQWFLTVKYANEPVVGNQPARNYLTATLDPISGRVRIYRP